MNEIDNLKVNKITFFSVQRSSKDVIDTYASEINSYNTLKKNEMFLSIKLNSKSSQYLKNQLSIGNYKCLQREQMKFRNKSIEKDECLLYKNNLIKWNFT